MVFDHVVAERDHEIGGLDRHEIHVARLQADREETARVLARDTALGHERRQDSDSRGLDEATELTARAPANRSVARQDDRALRGEDRFEGLVHDLVGRPGPAQTLRLDGLRVRRHARDVFGQLDVARARLLRRRQLEGLADDFGDVVRVAERPAPLGEGAVHLVHVHVLVALFMEPHAVRLAGDGDDGSAIEIGVRNARHQIRRAGAERREAHARFSGQAAVHVRHEGGALLVPRQNEVDRGVGE